MARSAVAKTETTLTPAQAMFDLLSNLGYVHQKVDFARIIQENDRNIYSYLGDPDSDKPRGFLAPSLHKLHEWAGSIARETGVQIQITLSPDGKLVLTADGTLKNGAPIAKPIEYRTCYDSYAWGSAKKPWVEEEA